MTLREELATVAYDGKTVDDCEEIAAALNKSGRAVELLGRECWGMDVRDAMYANSEELP